MRKAEPENNSYRECDRRRKQSRERKHQRKNKNNFRNSGHRPEREYQSRSRMSQQEGTTLQKRCCSSAFAEIPAGIISPFLLKGRGCARTSRERILGAG